MDIMPQELFFIEKRVRSLSSTTTVNWRKKAAGLYKLSQLLAPAGRD